MKRSASRCSGRTLFEKKGLFVSLYPFSGTPTPYTHILRCCTNDLNRQFHRARWHIQKICSIRASPKKNLDPPFSQYSPCKWGPFPLSKIGSEMAAKRPKNGQKCQEWPKNRPKAIELFIKLHKNTQNSLKILPGMLTYCTLSLVWTFLNRLKRFLNVFKQYKCFIVSFCTILYIVGWVWQKIRLLHPFA